MEIEMLEPVGDVSGMRSHATTTAIVARAIR
jgi:hypothetical protein